MTARTRPYLIAFAIAAATFALAALAATATGALADDSLRCDETPDAPYCSGPSDPEGRDAPTGSSDDCVTDYDHPECEVRCYDDGTPIDCPAWITDPDAPVTHDPWAADELEEIADSAPATPVEAQPDYTG